MVKYYSTNRVSDLDSVFHALADPTRRAILERLAEEGDLMVTRLAEPFDISLPAVSKHLRVLEKAGLLVQDRDGRIRRCQLVADPLQAAASWIDRYSHFWEVQFDALADYLESIQPPGDAVQGRGGERTQLISYPSLATTCRQRQTHYTRSEKWKHKWSRQNQHWR